jgi:hypothetical protein
VVYIGWVLKVQPGKTFYKNKKRRITMNQLQISIVNPNDMRAGIIFDLGQETPITSNDQLGRVKFETPFPENSTVIVIPYIQTAKGWQSEDIRINEVTNEGFRIGYFALSGSDEKGISVNLSDGRHVPENIGWIAIRVK